MTDFVVKVAGEPGRDRMSPITRFTATLDNFLGRPRIEPLAGSCDRNRYLLTTQRKLTLASLVELSARLISIVS